MKIADLPHENAALAVFPSVEGFGWMLFDGPLSAVRWGVCAAALRADTDTAKNARCLSAFEKLLAKWRPPIVLFEAFAGPGTRRQERIRKLGTALVAACSVSGAKTRVITREQVAKCFENRQAETRHEVAEVVADYIPEIRLRLPDKRKIWNKEYADMALFNATALLFAYYSISQKMIVQGPSEKSLLRRDE